MNIPFYAGVYHWAIKMPTGHIVGMRRLVPANLPTLSTRFGSNASLPVARKKSNLSARVVRLSPFLRYLNFTKETFSGVMMDLRFNVNVFMHT